MTAAREEPGESAGWGGGLAVLTVGRYGVAACRFYLLLNSESAVGLMKTVPVSEKVGEFS